MTSGFRWLLDLLCVVALTVVGAAVVLVDLGGWIRTFLVVPLVVLVPGWALLAALFPARHEAESRPFDADRGGLMDPRSNKAGIGGVERLAFSALASIVLVPLVGVAVHLSPMAIRPVPVLVGLVAAIAVFLAVAFVRRALLPADRRYEPNLLAPVTHLSFGASAGGLGGGGDRSRAFSLALGVALLLFATSIGYAAVNPPTGDGFTELGVEMENVTGDTQSMYPAVYGPDETRTLPLRISNHEHAATDYEVVVALQRLEGGDDRGVAEQSRIATRSLSLAAGETREFSVDVTPSMTGDDLRIVVLAYVDSVPERPTVESADESLELPIDVGADAGQNGGAESEANVVLDPEGAAPPTVGT